MATFTWIPEYSLTEGIEYRTLVSKGESGRVRRRSKVSVGRRTFKLVFNLLDNTEAAAIWSFYQARKGAYEAFDWTDPRTSEALKARFKSDSLDRDYFTYGYHKLTLDLEEVFTNEL